MPAGHGFGCERDDDRGAPGHLARQVPGAGKVGGEVPGAVQELPRVTVQLGTRIPTVNGVGRGGRYLHRRPIYRMWPVVCLPLAQRASVHASALEELDNVDGCLDPVEELATWIRDFDSYAIWNSQRRK